MCYKDHRLPSIYPYLRVNFQKDLFLACEWRMQATMAWRSQYSECSGVKSMYKCMQNSHNNWYWTNIGVEYST